MAKSTFNYYQAFNQQIGYAVQSIDFVQEALSQYDTTGFRLKMQEMHLLENKADEVKHDIVVNLRSDFVVPMERDDIANFAQDLDSVVDSIEQVLTCCYIYHVPEITPEATEMLQLISRAVYSLQKAVALLPHFKRANTEMFPLLSQVNDAEEAGDGLHIEVLHHLYDEQNGLDSRKLLAYAKLYDRSEHALNTCKRAAGRIEEIVMNNL